ncbi:MAG: DUF5403 family protein [Propionibacteriaceae bacterium]|jgi:hypothetical protein|nr:DUF5403 family protein [Propionibacteriaceae bacterium]
MMGARDIGRLVAGLPGVRAAVRDAAQDIRDDARMLATGHGTLPECISLEYPNEYDVDVVMAHEAALSIEYGHDDAVYDTGWVAGLHIMRDAAAGL